MTLPLIRCSEASIRINCPGSIYLSTTVPAKEDTEFTLEGTHAHDWAAKAILEPEELEACPDQEMLYHAKNYASFIQKIETKVGGFNEQWVEQKVRYNQYLQGTSDFAALYKDRSRIFIADYKYGQGVGVLAEENFQLVAYLLCVLAHHNLKNIERATMCIYQPRARDGEGDVRHWTIFANDIKEWKELFDYGISQCVAVHEGRLEPYYEAGKHCFWCVAKPVCKAFADNIKKESMGLIAALPEAKLPAIPDPNRLTHKQIAQLLAIEPRVKELYKVLRPYAEQLLMRGEVDAKDFGFKLVEGKSNRKWIADTAKVATTLKQLGATKVYKDPVLVGIGEAEKQVGKGKINSITMKPSGKPTLVPLEDKRAAIVFDNGADLLSSLETEEDSDD